MNSNTDYRERGRENTQRIRDHICSVIQNTPGNTAVFVPSYSALEEIFDGTIYIPGTKILTESRTWSKQDINSEFNKGVQPDYTYEGEGDTIPWWLYVVAVLVIAAAGAFIVMKRRSEDAGKELADIFSYTAELLAAGDSMREAIFQCYESMVHVLMGRGQNSGC